MKLTAILLSLFAVVATTNVKAATAASDMQMHEIIFNPSKAVLAFGGAVTGAASTTQFALAAGYNYHFMPGLMVGLQQFGFSAGGGQVGFNFLAGLTLNWPMTDRFDNAFFFAAGAGINWNKVSSAAAATSSFMWALEAGKRFEIVEHVVYRPSVQVMFADGHSAAVNVNVLAFSAAF